jgi:iron(III) transport system ATP-binding protein
MSELVVTGLTKRFGATEVLRGLDLTVPQGTLVAVLGPSGCGKTTLLRIVAGFETADAGTVVIGGRTVTHLAPERRRIGVVPQEGALFPHLSVAGNVAFGLHRGAARSTRVAEMLELVGLAGYGERMPHELSGGQQQRVALARALAPSPALVLLDEPFSALDTGLRASIREDVRTALHAADATAVIVTHDQQEALSMADLVAVVRDGRVVQSARPADLYASPGDIGVARFVGEAVVLDATAHDGFADTVLGRLPVPAGDGRGTVVIRPEQIVVGTNGNGVPAQVTGSVFYGHDAMVRLKVGGTEVLARVQGGGGPHPDAEVTLRVAGEVSFFPG